MSRFVHDSQNTMAPVCPFTSTKNAMLKIWILSALGPLETVSSFQREISAPDLRRQPWMLWVFGVFHWLQSSCLMTVKCPQSLFWRCLFLMCYHSSHVYRYDCCYHDCHSCHCVFFSWDNLFQIPMPIFFVLLFVLIMLHHQSSICTRCQVTEHRNETKRKHVFARWIHFLYVLGAKIYIFSETKVRPDFFRVLKTMLREASW